MVGVNSPYLFGGNMKIISNYEYDSLIKLQESHDKLSDEVEELKYTNKELRSRINDLNGAETKLRGEFEFNEKKVILAMEDANNKKLAKVTADYNEKLNAYKTKYQEEHNAKIEKLFEDQYQKLSSSMAKLHEEGNATTKYIQDMNKEMLKSVSNVFIADKKQLTDK